MALPARRLAMGLWLIVLAGCGEVPSGKNPGDCRIDPTLCGPNQMCDSGGLCVAIPPADAGGGTGGDGGGSADAGAPQPDAGPDAGAIGVDAGAEDTDAGVVDGGPAAECETGTAQICGSKVGVCSYGSQLCVDGRWGECIGGVRPSPETCDGLDNDCNGVIDDRTPACVCLDGQTQTCGVSEVGACRLGSQVCVDGNWGTCVGNVDPGARLCDDQDRDCNGELDYTQDPCQCRNGLTQVCGINQGICRQGSETCVNGMWSSCEGGVGKRTENADESVDGLCNGEDDNCDGQIDEGCNCVPPEVRSCGTEVGLCELGMQTCLSTGAWGTCEGGVQPATRVCDGEDHDCDGTPDHMQAPCQCLNGSTQPCGMDVGECRAGTQTCVDGLWGSCVGGVAPSPEVCDGLDNDCDGTPDQGLGAPSAVACWTASDGTVVCSDPNDRRVAPLATVQLDGQMSSDPQGDALSYSWRIASAPEGSTVTITNPTSARPTLFAQLAGDYVVCLTVTDSTSCQSGESCVTIHVVPSAKIHLQLVWDKDETDMDLHFMMEGIDSFMDPSPCKFSLDCFWNCRSPDWGANGNTNDPTLDIDDVDGFGPENINLDTPVDGTYAIAVHYWCDRAGPRYDGDPQGDSEATLRLFIDGVLVQSWKKTLSSAERWYVADLSWDNNAAVPYNITNRGNVERSDFGCDG